jgi:hypothetical protein
MAQNAGNTPNTDGFTPQKTSSNPGRPGAITRGPGHNKPRVHLVSSRGKIPAEVVAHALAQRQAKVGTGGLGPDKLPNDTQGQTTADVYEQQLKNPAGVAPRPKPPHQNNPALAGRFTPQGIRASNHEKEPVVGIKTRLGSQTGQR